MIEGTRAPLTREQLVAGIALAVLYRWAHHVAASGCAAAILVHWVAMSPPSWANLIAGLINAVVTWKVLRP
jgi:hypothetical protein